MSPSECHEAFVRAVVDKDGAGVRAALRNGLDVNFVDREGRFALHYAAVHGDGAAARALLDGGAQIDCRDRNGNTPLSNAVFYAEGRKEFIEFLLANGANPNIENLHGVSAATLARSIANYDYSELF
ncbi:MAG TPA: ankyrin repeat domain-containing protein [Croceibacterium sp.]